MNDTDDFRFGHFSIDRWMRTVPGGYLADTRFGRAPARDVPDLLLKDGALRDVYMLDLALFVAAERTGVKVAAGMARLADDEATVTFLASQVLDEARHFEAFAARAAELGVPPEVRDRLGLDFMPGAYRTFLDTVLATVDDGDFEAGLIGLNVILEGMAFPLYEYEMRYWAPFDPGLVEVVEGAFRDECRHVGFGEKRLAHRLARDPGARRRVQKKVDEYARLMRAAFDEFLATSVAMYDAAVREHPDLCAQVEIIPGRSLLHTSTEDQVRWLEARILQGHARRLARIGLDAGRFEAAA
ncbi:MAG: ferritin-like domain-containing protein [Planctomycetes bacterium]|nr:ferritin-like domain-containing protein [Planctomycetota bacterium]